jgi:toxin FitB
VNGFLLDTNVIEELIKPRPEPSVIAWVEAAGESLLFLSVLTSGEIPKGVSSLLDSTRRIALANPVGA